MNIIHTIKIFVNSPKLIGINQLFKIVYIVYCVIKLI